MAAVFYSAVFLLGGLWLSRCLLPKKHVVWRVWIGLTLGMVLEMTLPAIFAFALDFSLPAHYAALGLLAVLCGAGWLLRDKRGAEPFGEEDKKALRLLLYVGLPLCAVGVYLQWTHDLRAAADGTWHVGQSTYGDLPLHLAIMTGMRNAKFPADYNILPGETLCYPFLSDSLGTTLMLFGADVRAAYLSVGIFMTVLTFCGYLLFALRLADTKKTAALAALFFFINGGLGFLYLIDMQGRVLGTSGSNELQSVAGLWNRIRLVIDGWYQTPANHAEFGTYNLRWSNVIVDMMVPQRTTLGGWTVLLPCLYLLYDGVTPEKYDLPEQKGRTAPHQKVLLGVMAGTLPMINTHCFLGLGLISVGWMTYDLIHEKDKKGVLGFWLPYGLLAVALAAPQLLIWTFRQALNASNDTFLRFSFNWVNGQMNYPDGYVWFYIKNIGLPFVLLLLSLLEKNRKRRFIASGAFVIFVLAECILFQTNPYDNNKLFLIWYMLCTVLAADYCREIWHKLRGLRGRYAVAALACVCFFATGTLAVAREIKSDYQMFSREQIGSARAIEANTDEHAVFMTGRDHINFVSSLSGRTIVCGPDTWLYYHGYDTSERRKDIEAFYTDPVGNENVLEKYGVSYITVTPNERAAYAVNMDALNALYTRVYENGGTVIFAVNEEEKWAQYD